MKIINHVMKGASNLYFIPRLPIIVIPIPCVNDVHLTQLLIVEHPYICTIRGCTDNAKADEAGTMTIN